MEEEMEIKLVLWYFEQTKTLFFNFIFFFFFLIERRKRY